MELDKRIIEGKKPLDCFDAKDARKQFIGKKGFFGAHESQFMDLDSCPKCVLDELKEVDNYAESPFMTSCDHCYRFFLPEEWVKEPEKKYRPFSLNEFLEGYMMGAIVEFRIKDCEVVEQSMLIGFQSSDDNDIPGDGYVLIGNCRYGLKELFNNYELNYLNKWQPFGVLDDNK